MYWGFKTFIFHGFGVQGYVHIPGKRYLSLSIYIEYIVYIYSIVRDYILLIPGTLVFLQPENKKHWVYKFHDFLWGNSGCTIHPTRIVCFRLHHPPKEFVSTDITSYNLRFFIFLTLQIQQVAPLIVKMVKLLPLRMIIINTILPKKK